MRTSVRWFHPESLGFFGVRPVCDPVHLGSLGSTLGVVGFIRDLCVYCGALRGSSGSSEAARFIGVRPCGLVFIWARWVNWGALWGCWNHPWSLG